MENGKLRLLVSDIQSEVDSDAILIKGQQDVLILDCIDENEWLLSDDLLTGKINKDDVFWVI